MKNEVKITKMSLSTIDGKLTPAEMENIMAGSFWNCRSVTGGLCAATIILAYSGPFAPLSAATGIGCGLGIYSGC